MITRSGMMKTMIKSPFYMGNFYQQFNPANTHFNGEDYGAYDS